MTESRARAFAKLAKDVDTSGNIIASGIAPTVELGGGTTVYATLDQLPRSGNTSGDTAFVTATSRFYIWNGVGWFNVAVVNAAPTITNAPNATYNLFANGSPTIITLAATDPDGDTLTWSYSAPDAVDKATITQADNVFTITPLTDIADTSFTIDFEVTDGINVSTASSTVNIDNRAPSITTSPAATYTLATDGSPTVITLAATDPDGGSITWTYANSGLTDQATVVQNGNEFTITPNSTPAVYADFTLTFTASDSIESTSTSPTTLSLTFNLVADQWSDTALSIGTSSTNSLDNSTFVDRSTNAHTVNVTNTPIQTAFHPYLDYWSVEFDGSGDYITYPDNTDYEFGTSAFTIELFVYFSTSTTTDYTFVTNYSDPNQGWGFQWRPNQYSSAPLRFFVGGATVSSTNSFTPEIGKWYHLAVTRSSGTAKIFVDGTEVASGSDTNNYNAGGSLTLGRIGNVNAQYFNGYISNVRIVKGTALYTSNFTPPSEKLTAVTNTVFLSNQSNRFVDNSTNNATPTIFGDPKVSAFNPFGQPSEYVPGENKGSIRFADGVSEKIEWDAFGGSTTGTIEFWIYPTTWSASSGNQGIWTQGSATPSIFLRNTGDTLDWYESGNKTNTYQPRAGEWIHVAYSIDNGSLSEYVNGTRTATASVSGFVNSINRLGTNGTYYFDGYISDFRMTYDVARYSGTTMTVPTSPVGTDADTKIYLPMDNAGVFDKTGYHNVVLNGTTVVSTAQSKYASSSLALTNRTFKVDYSPAMNIGANDFTMEMWVYPTNSTGGTLWSAGYNGENRFDFGWQRSSGIRLLLEVGNVNETVFTSSTAVSNYLNQWSHIAVVRSANTFNLYVNGAGVATGTSTKILIADVTDGWTFGGREFDSNFDDGSTNDPFYGYIEGVQFTRAAKYTTNFTPPIQEQGRTYQAIS